MPSVREHPLLLPEILQPISCFVSLSDAISCARVCRTWNDPFTSAIWHTIDFEEQDRFVDVDPAVVKKHGHRIRSVLAVTQDDEIQALHHLSVCKVTNLTIVMPGTVNFQAYCGDLLRQNAASLKELDIIAEGDSPVFPFDAIFLPTGGRTTSPLSVLRIQNLTMTRDGFSSLLKMCPALEEMSLALITLLSTSCSEPYQHTGVKHLKAPLEQLFGFARTSAVEGPSILAHFPQLTKFHSWCPDDPPPFPYDDMEIQFAKHCPLITEVITETHAAVTPMFLGTIKNLVHITVEEITSSVIMAMLFHGATLETVRTFAPDLNYYFENMVPELEEKKACSIALGWEFQLIPQTCARLTKLELPTFVMDMDDIERKPWVCMGLSQLFVRIRGLETAKTIDHATVLWAKHMKEKWQDRSGPVTTPSEVPEVFRISENFQVSQVSKASEDLEISEDFEDDDDGNWIDIEDDEEEDETVCGENSIPARFARHFSKFEKIQCLWIGNGLNLFMPLAGNI
ncbi:hypothetical protein BGX34_004726 [Mortierella sp. NVP85]|nr:hypothetical protein BGX34_004726 [Mortierella sp. NVP85]